MAMKLSVPATFNVTDLNVGINTTHEWRGDIRVTLQSPVGTLRQIVTEDINDSNDHYDILLDGDSGAPLDNDLDDNIAKPFYDRIVGQVLLNYFDGEAANSTWTL